ncbi:hypothetical protein K502DRAFT_322429 [Neoconidiobolus thromboides FSU 785]|nr:hypothetical protein K502DRAFT_322429 [Neoconidiobolus thromboides FSU 785]
MAKNDRANVRLILGVKAQYTSILSRFNIKAPKAILSLTHYMDMIFFITFSIFSVLFEWKNW